MREINEDAVLESGNLYIVADGMGGHKAGEVASGMAISVIQQYVEDSLGLLSGDKLIEKAVSAANAAIHRRSKNQESLRSMGTTVTALYREGDIAYIAHVGDCRAYLLRDSRLKQLTTDHSLVGKLVEDGEISEEDARIHPQRNIILRALGLERTVEVEVISVKVEPGDLFLLCTDGLHGMIDDEEIRSILLEGMPPQEAAEKLVESALERGGHDNVSVILVSFKPAERAAAARPIAEKDEEVAHVVLERSLPEEEDTSDRGRMRFLAKALAVFLAIALLAFFGGGYLLWKRCYFVGIENGANGKIALFQGFPFWNLTRVVRVSSHDITLLRPESEEKLRKGTGIESRKDALRTMHRFECEAKGAPIVPDVRGMLYQKAKSALEMRGFKVKGNAQSRGFRVKDQFPKPGRRYGKGRKVRLIPERENNRGPAEKMI